MLSTKDLTASSRLLIKPGDASVSKPGSVSEAYIRDEPASQYDPYP